ncbi:MAG: HAMP domain-containing histidine kinase [Sphingobium sp.]|nr:HAMP domain-containing histidine kinase [Sphingobium sp.]
MISLRSSAGYRIAFTYAAAFAAAVLLLGVAVYLAADHEFRRQRDVAISKEVADLARERDPAELKQEIAGREATRATDSFGYALFDRNGRRIAGTLETPRPAVGFSTIIFQDPVEGPDVARAKAVDLADGRRLVVAVDSEAVEEIDKTILTLFGIAFAVVIVIGAVSALVLGRYLRGRLSTISATANAIVAGDTALRMPVGPQGDEFDAAALALNTMLDRIAGLMDNLRQVSSDVAHDLRTPLLRLRNELEQVGKVEGAAQRAIDLGDELLKLFAAVLRIAEVEGGELRQSFTRVDLSALAETVCDGFLPAVYDSGRILSWSILPDIAVLGDRELLAQAIANLLDNAIVHTPPATAITLSLVDTDGLARLVITDNGPGVSPADSVRLTRRFFRGEASRTTPGNGLGLSLVAAVANAHGGEIEIDGARGLRVTITLPMV